MTAEGPQQPVSWCRVECVVGGVESVRLNPTQAPPPPLVTMSLSLTLALNLKTRTNEVTTLTAAVVIWGCAVYQFMLWEAYYLMPFCLQLM